MPNTSPLLPFAAIALFSALVGAAACSSGGDEPEPPTSPTAPTVSAEGSAPTPAPPPPPTPPASEWLHGEFEFRTAHLGRDVHLGLRFEDGTLARTREGVATASEPFRIVDDAPERVILEITPDDGPPKARELRFEGPDVLWDTAAPELRFERVHGRALAEGSGDAP